MKTTPRSSLFNVMSFLGGTDKDDESMGKIFQRQLENIMLNSASLCDVKGINRVFLLEHGEVVIAEDGSIAS